MVYFWKGRIIKFKTSDHSASQSSCLPDTSQVFMSTLSDLYTSDHDIKSCRTVSINNELLGGGGDGGGWNLPIFG